MRWSKLGILRSQYPWPDAKPDTPMHPHEYDGWPNKSFESMLKRLSATAHIIVELGTWTGRVARLLCDSNPRASVITIDHFLGSKEHARAKYDNLRPVLYETCLNRCWGHQKQLTVIRENTIIGMAAIHAVGLIPDMIEIDASHEEPDVLCDILVAAAFWPNAVLCGDDWHWKSVRNAVELAASKLARPLWHDEDRAWSISHEGMD